jgi:hypothetical protein
MMYLVHCQFVMRAHPLLYVYGNSIFHYLANIFPWQEALRFGNMLFK